MQPSSGTPPSGSPAGESHAQAAPLDGRRIQLRGGARLARTVAEYDAARPHLEGRSLRSVCYAPFLTMDFDATGAIRLCNHSHTVLADVSAGATLLEVWRGEGYARYRGEMQEYVLDEDNCRHCVRQCEAGSSAHVFAVEQFDRWAKDDPTPLYPRRLIFRLNSTCNLACVMCDGWTSSRIRRERDGLPVAPSRYGEAFFRDLEEILPHVEHIELYGGEPFLVKEHLRVLEILERTGSVCSIYVNTNGVSLGRRARHFLETLNFRTVAVSMDAVNPEVHERIRFGLDHHLLLRNLEYFLELRERRGLDVMLNVTEHRMNWFELPELFRFAETRRLILHVNTCIHPHNVTLYTLPADQLGYVLDFLERERERLLAEHPALSNLPSYDFLLSLVRDELAGRGPGWTPRADVLNAACDGLLAAPLPGAAPFGSPERVAEEAERVARHLDPGTAARVLGEMLTRVRALGEPDRWAGAAASLDAALAGRSAPPRSRRALVAGWFSVEHGGATAGDLSALGVVCGWLSEAGVAHDVALAPPFEGAVTWRLADPARYTHLVFVCGPFQQDAAEKELLARFPACRRIGVNVSMGEPLEGWNPFDLLLERDSSRTSRPDLALVSENRKVPVIGVCLVEPDMRAMDREVNHRIQQLLESREAATVLIDTRMDANITGLRTPAEVESLIARMDVVVTTRLHGAVLALKNGVPALVVDPYPGHPRLLRQMEALDWPVVLPAPALDESALTSALDYCLSGEARARATACARRARERLVEVRERLLEDLGVEPERSRTRPAPAPGGSGSHPTAGHPRLDLSAYPYRYHLPGAEWTASDGSAWLLRVAGDNAAHLRGGGEGPLRVVLEKLGSRVMHDVQLNRLHLEVREGRAYDVRFSARADVPRRAGVGVARAREPWSNLGFYQEVRLTPAWAEWHHTFVARSNEGNARLHFDVGAAGGAVEVRDVSVRESEARESAEVASVSAAPPG
jgi:MoaA/NifB/PqqE/SkfB family radical SAM enzyme